MKRIFISNYYIYIYIYISHSHYICSNTGMHIEFQDVNSHAPYISVQHNASIQSPRLKYNKYSNEKRNLLVNKIFREGIPIKQASNLLKINYYSAKRIIKIFKDEKRIEVKKKVGSKPKLR